MTHKNKKPITLLILVIFVVSGITILLEKNGVIDIFSAKNNPVVQADPSINFGPPTQVETDAGNAQKEILISEEQDRETPVNKGLAEVVITDASQYDDKIEVRAFIANVVADGECTFDFTINDLLVSETTPAYADATTTPCIALTIDRSKFSKAGVWAVNVRYSSEHYTGSSQSEIIIQ